MISFGIKSDISKVQSALDQLGASQVPFATSLALNRVAQFSRETLRNTMARVFDRPKPFTLNSLFVKPSTKTNLVAIVGHKSGSPVNQYLRSEIEGGLRAPKKLESILSRGQREYLVPGKDTRLDAYGNIPRAIMNRIIQAQRAGSKADAQGVFIVPPGSKSGLTPGIYERKGGSGKGSLKLLMVFVSKAQYRPLYDMQGIVSRVVESEFGKQFAASMDYALSTAKLKL
jgi:hypothetical protein